MGLCALYSALNYIAEVVMNDWKKKPSVRTVYAMTQFTFIIALALLSIFPHQEPRFLIPLTVPIVLMNAHKLRWKCGNTKPFLVLWYIFNISTTIFFGLVHQGGVTPMVKFIGRDLQLHQSTYEANFIWSNTYMPPTFELLRMSEKSKRQKLGKSEFEFPSYFMNPKIRMNFHDFAGKDISEVRLEILTLATRSKLKRNVENFIIVPSHLYEDLVEIMDNQVNFQLVNYVFPHISMESIPNISDEITELTKQLTDGKVITDFTTSFSTCFNLVGQFGLSLYKFEIPADSTTSVHFKSNKV